MGVATNASADPVAYVVNNGGQFGTVDLTTGLITDIGASDVPYEGLALSQTGSLYGSASNGDIYSVDKTSGAATVAGTGAPSGPLAVRFNPAGTLYGLTRGASGALTLYSSDSPSDTFSTIGSTGVFSSYWDLAFVNPTSLLMVADPSGDSGLYSVNTTTGAVTLIGSTGFLVDTLVFEDGVLYGFDPGSHQILTINTVTGAGTAIATYQDSNDSFGPIYGAAESVYTVSGPVGAPMPAPAWTTLVLLAGLGTLHAAKRWRTN